MEDKREPYPFSTQDNGRTIHVIIIVFAILTIIVVGGIKMYGDPDISHSKGKDLMNDYREPTSSDTLAKEILILEDPSVWPFDSVEVIYDYRLQ